jgi:hypothetical protein
MYILAPGAETQSTQRLVTALENFQFIFYFADSTFENLSFSFKSGKVNVKIEYIAEK